MTSSSGTIHPLYANGYEILDQVGDGVDGPIYSARCNLPDEIVAIKILDPEKCTNDLGTIQKEVHELSLLDHPNLVTPHCSFLDGSNVWIVTPYMSSVSCLTVLKSAYSKGLEESVVATLLQETLAALGYLHGQGHIHRDVKAGNILADSNGKVKLGAFGITFSGTPSWMAPEVKRQVDDYDFKADIWSFGITALELAHGHTLFASNSPMTVLRRTLQNAPCTDCEQGKKFSKSFRELVAACLVKDPKNRPTATELLDHGFFKHLFPSQNLSRILYGLTPLSQYDRKLKEEDTKEKLSLEKLSQIMYRQGLSAWDSDMEDLMKQITPIPDDEHMEEIHDLSSAEDFDFEVSKGISFESPFCEEESVKSSEIYPVSFLNEKENNKVQSSEQPASPVNPVSFVADQIVPCLQNLLVQNNKQRDTLVGLAKLYGPITEIINPVVHKEGEQITETELLCEVQILQHCVMKLEEEVEKQKLRNAELEENMNRLMSNRDPSKEN